MNLDRLDDAVNALERIADALELLAHRNDPEPVPRCIIMDGAGQRCALQRGHSGLHYFTLTTLR